MLEKIMPELPQDDVPAAVRYYRDVLGFSVNYEDPSIGVLDRGEVRILAIARTAEHRGIGSCYVYVADADALHAELVAKEARVLSDPVDRPWGLREFEVRDLSNNRIAFGQPFE